VHQVAAITFVAHLALIGSLVTFATAVGSDPQSPTRPVALPSPPQLPVPQDRPFAGTIELAVDATDVDHQIFVVHETIPVQAPGDTVLLYPQWEPASHAPTATVAELAGLRVQADGRALSWSRDPVNMHAFHVDVPEGTRALSIDFQFLAPMTSHLLRADMVIVPWHRVLLYPAGWFVRNIPVAATLTLPPGLAAYSSLNSHAGHDNMLVFDSVTLDRLVDSPVYAARHARQIVLSDTAPRVVLDVLADAPEDLAVRKPQVERLESLIEQVGRTFGEAPYRRYDLIVTLSDVLAPGGSGGGVEHFEEGEINLPRTFFTDPTRQLENADLIAHEYVHAWNGLARTPADLWAPTYNQPVAGSLLWVYEGQTEFWGRVKAARAGLRDRQQTLDMLAIDAATVASRTGRRWKDLQDSTNDAIYMAKRRIVWRDWQRREDYYAEGVLLWLDVDARLRELSGGRRGLDDFARTFFVSDTTLQVRTYTFEDVCAALNRVAADDWASFLLKHLRTHSTDEALAGLARAGWKLVYDDTPSETFRQAEASAGTSNLSASIGLTIDEDGRIDSVMWDGPAFKAGLAPGMHVIDVQGKPFSIPSLLAATRADVSQPLILTVKGDTYPRTVEIDAHHGLRYPHLQRVAGKKDYLSDLLTPVAP